MSKLSETSRRPDTGAPEDTDTGTLGMTQERPGILIMRKFK